MPSIKIMFKGFITILICFLFPFSMAGQRNQLPRLERAKMSIVNILKNLDYESRVTDGIIVFSDGTRSFSLDCIEETDEVFFGKLYVSYGYDDVVTFERVSRFALTHNYKATKIVQSENEYTFRSEFYFSDPDYVYESIGLFLNTMKKAESMLKSICQTYAAEKTVSIDSLQISYDTNSIPFTIKGSIVLDSKNAIGDTITVMVRVYCDNALMMNGFSAENYSFIERIVIAGEHQVCELSEWVFPESFKGSSNIRYEVWDERGRHLFSKEVKE